MYMEHDGPPDTKPRGSSGYLPGGVSGEKAAPTAEEIAAARQHAAMLRDRFPERTRIENVAVALLAALDAAEALEKAAEDKLARACALADRTAASHVETRTRAETAERERDELRTKLDGAIVVSDSPETRERIARELWGGEGYSEPWGEAAKNSHPVTYRCVLRDTDAVLAALRESRL